MSLKVGILQMDIIWHKPLENFKRIEKHLNNQKELDILVLPEMFTTGFTKENHLFQQDSEASLQKMKEWAGIYQIMVMGSCIVYEKDSYFNRFYAVYPDGEYVKYDKRHLFTMAREQEFYKAGTEQLIFSYKEWRFMPLICFDLRFPVWSRNLLKNSNKGYDIAIYVANWPKVRIEHWNTLLKARAIENQCYVVGCNRVGIDGYNIEYNGSSAIYDFEGKTLCFSENQEELLITELLKEPLETYRKNFPAYLSIDNFEIIL